MPKKPCTQFVFCTYQEDADDYSNGLSVEVSTKIFFDRNGFMQDGYTPNEYQDLLAVMNKYGLTESTESSFECEQYTAEDITQKLNSEPNFQFSQKMHDFIH